MAQIKQTSLRNILVLGVAYKVSTLSVNTSGYPYVTLITKPGTDGKTKSQNIYFGKQSAEKILNMYEPGQPVLKALKDATVVESTNEQGEVRFKLSLPGETRYASDAEMAIIFGLEEEIGEFNMKLFKEGFAVAADAPTPDNAANTDAIRQAAGASATV